MFYIDLRGEQVLNVFVALAMLAAGNIGVSEFVHQDYFGFPRQNGIHIHFFKDGSFVFDFLARDGFDLRG
jgi:hypothetical protein